MAINSVNSLFKPQGCVYYLKSRAKLNLTLSIVGRKANGYHLIHSVFCFLGLADNIKIKENNAAGPRLFISGQFSNLLGKDQDSLSSNLVIKALVGMSKKYGTSTDFDIFLEKNIPPGSGLGGGSSNAATIIDFVDKYFDLNLSKEERVDIGLSIGADVPFFLQNQMSICKGIGEIIEPVNNFPDQSINLVVAWPGYLISTPQVYGKFVELKSGEYTEDNPYLATEINDKNIVDIIKECGNDLTDPALLIKPNLNDFLGYMDNHDSSVVSGMSGSGSACFSICRDAASANQMRDDLKIRFGESCFVVTDMVFSMVQSNQVSPSSRVCYDMFGDNVCYGAD